MLTDEQLNDMMEPIIVRQQSINEYVLLSIAEKIKEIGKMSLSDVKKLNILVAYGADIRKLNNKLALLSRLQVRDIKHLIKEVAYNVYKDAKPLYDYRHKPFKSFQEKRTMQRYVKAIGDVTANKYKNLSNSKATGFLIRDPKNPTKLRFHSINDTYTSVLDEAIRASQAGLIDYRTAMRRTIRQLSDSGVRRIAWDSGYTQRLDTAVRRNLLDGIHAINQAIEDEIGKEIDADGKELSAHPNCAMDHEPFQGHRFTNAEYNKLQNNEDFQDVDGEEFTAVERTIGMWNCRHIAYSVILGLSKPRYSKKQLQRMIKQNHDGYVTSDGKHLTLYECTQLQRKLETRIRYAKDRQMMFQESGDIIAARAERQKVIQLTNEYKAFSKSCGLKLQLDRASVSGYRAIKNMVNI